MSKREEKLEELQNYFNGFGLLYEASFNLRSNIQALAAEKANLTRFKDSVYNHRPNSPEEKKARILLTLSTERKIQQLDYEINKMSKISSNVDRNANLDTQIES